MSCSLRDSFLILIGGLKIRRSDFSRISRLLERFRMEHIGIKVNLDFKLQINSLCSIRIRSRKLDIGGLLPQLVSNPYKDRRHQLSDHVQLRTNWFNKVEKLTNEQVNMKEDYYHSGQKRDNVSGRKWGTGDSFFINRAFVTLIKSCIWEKYSCYVTF